MAVYTILDQASIAHLLAQHYALGDFVRADGIADGVENSNYKLTMRDQNGAEIGYILTIFEQRTNAAELPFFMQLMQHLSANGIDCPQPVAAKNGDLIGQVVGKPFVIISFLQGKAATQINTAQATQLGATLGTLHLGAQNFTMSRANDWSQAAWQQMFEQLGTALNNIETGLHDLVRDELSFLRHHWPSSGLPQGVIHADLFPDNVFFDTQNHLSGVIDFYFACNDFLAYDLAITLNAWCFEQGRFDTKNAKAIYQSYHATRHLSEAENAALPILLRGAALRFLLTRAHDWHHHAQGAKNTTQALGETKDPLEYATILRFHQEHKTITDYGFLK
jgi:homoserine kinase type II